jgi:hypothetical protein
MINLLLHGIDSSNSSVASGVERLDQLRADLRVMFDKPHQFLWALKDMVLVESWIGKIRQIPDYFIESVISNLPEMEYVDLEMKEKTIVFLKDRRTYLWDHIMKHRELFPNLKEGERDDIQ